MGNRIKLDLSVDNYAVMGNPIQHSKSPQIHSLFAKQTGQNLHYQSIAVEPDCFPISLAQFQDAGGKGLNITVPFKQDAYQLCDRLTARAKKACAVNTICLDSSHQRYGDITDGVGLLNDLVDNFGLALQDSAILILGAGGAARGILDPLCQQQPARIVIANRTVQRAQDLAAAYQDEGMVSAVSFQGLSGQQFDLVINATAASLYNLLPPLPDDILCAGACCYDLMYNDEPTPFVRWGAQQGAALSVDGLGMLVEQAAASFFIWRKIRPDTRSVIDHINSMR